MWPALIPLLSGLLDRVLPDQQAAADAKLKLLDMAQRGDLAQLDADVKIATAQADINKTEAASSSVFVAGWRPAVGWTCALAVFFKFVGGPVLFMGAQAVGVSVELPTIETAELWPVLLGMLGLGGLRTVEKIKGAA